MTTNLEKLQEEIKRTEAKINFARAVHTRTIVMEVIEMTIMLERLKELEEEVKYRSEHNLVDWNNRG
jgi:hypothetical protein